ncbi:hypothetical protein GOBAR_AA30020 [Gossypium barbadense]|uniref:Uncharacterized protein n=1 Tax=Gossypium barbadense TaxID=3634 RepID=A0A2P5WHW4_GOSBA|nr:hypothetical protein GOBAR_AA30020 [Gossypium barbadense]
MAAFEVVQRVVRGEVEWCCGEILVEFWSVPISCKRGVCPGEGHDLLIWQGWRDEFHMFECAGVEQQELC